MTERIGAVSYLNTRPLIYGLERELRDRKLLLDLPSRLADQLVQNELDVALIPSVEYLRSTDWAIVSDACIACRGPVRSVQLLFRGPPERTRSLALDEGSRTSAALAQVLLFDEFGVRPELRPLPIEAPLNAIAADALLVIGDRAMSIDTSQYVETWDLGQRWNVQTGLPFVFAMWVSGSHFADQPAVLQLAEDLQASRDLGLANLDEIVTREAPQFGLTRIDCLRYFEEQLHFHLGPREMAGLDLFQSRAMTLGLVPAKEPQESA
ncbi:MAG: menaquinone biosynthesis protein [Pirellulaceae bacterium]